MAFYLSAMKKNPLPLILFIIDAFLMGGGAIAVITSFVILFYFLPKSVAGFIEKDKEKFKKYSIRLVIYMLMVVAIIAGLFLNNKFAEYKSKFIVAALEEYKAKYSHYPPSLDKLLPEFLTKIPLAKYSFNGQFRYVSFEDDVHWLTFASFPPYGSANYKLKEKKWFYQNYGCGNLNIFICCFYYSGFREWLIWINPKIEDAVGELIKITQNHRRLKPRNHRTIGCCMEPIVSF
ncbi:MAG: hypothetical protein WDL87_02265 [Candidatus Omnitrophota bacterium]